MKTQSVKLDIMLQARDTKLKQCGLSQAAEARMTFSEAIFFAIIAAVVHYRYSHLTPPRTHSLGSNIGSYQVDVNLALSIEQTPVEPFKSSHLLARLIHVFFLRWLSVVSTGLSRIATHTLSRGAQSLCPFRQGVFQDQQQAPGGLHSIAINCQSLQPTVPRVEGFAECLLTQSQP
jgi:hypothetical protein